MDEPHDQPPGAGTLRRFPAFPDVRGGREGLETGQEEGREGPAGWLQFLPNNQVGGWVMFLLHAHKKASSTQPNKPVIFLTFKYTDDVRHSQSENKGFILGSLFSDSIPQSYNIHC